MNKRPNALRFSIRDGLLAACVGIVTGARSTAGLRRISASPLVRRLVTAEAIADKLPFTPPRTEALPLILRMTVAGAAASRVSDSRSGRWIAGAIGGLFAAGSSYAFYTIRKKALKRGRIAGFAVGIGEDAIVYQLGKALENRLAA